MSPNPSYQAFLWNNDTRKIEFVRYQAERQAPILPWQGNNYYPVVPFPGFYLHPATEESLSNMAFAVWKLGFLKQRPTNPASSTVVEYNESYARDRIQASSVTSLEQYLYSPFPYVSLKDGVVGMHEGFNFRRSYHDHMERALKELPETPGRLVEIGSGGGHNILALKSRFPQMEVHGVEFSTEGAALTHDLGQTLNLPLHLATGDFCGTLPYTDDFFDVSLSVGSLHEITEEQFQKVFTNLYRITKKHIFLYEPFPELWPESPRGWASLQYYLNRRYLSSTLRQLIARSFGGKYQIQSAYRLKNGGNPLNELCFVRLDLLKNGETAAPDQLSPDYYR